jgi:hypothetical protein
MKRLLASLIAILFVAAPLADARRVNLVASGGGFLTITAGTPIRLAITKTLVDRLFIEGRHGASTGIIYVMLGVPVATTCNAADPSQLTAELAPATATAPGIAFNDPVGANGNTPSDREDLALACIDGTHTGDTVIVSYWSTN